MKKFVGLLLLFAATAVAQVALVFPNAGTTGTTLNKLAKLTGAPSTAVITATTDTAGAIGVVIAGAGTTGSALISYVGPASVVFDGATTAGHYVVLSSTVAGDAHDSGVSSNGGTPPSGQIIGIITSTNGGAGTYTMLLNVVQAGTGSGGSGTLTNVTITGTAGQITVTGTASCSSTTVVGCTLSLPSGLVLPGTINKLTLTQPATGSTITVVDGKTITISNTLTLTGTDAMTINFPNPASVTDGDCAKLTKSGSIIGVADAGTGACGSGGGGYSNLTQNADGSLNFAKAYTGAAAVAPTYNSGGTTTLDLSQGNFFLVTMSGGNTTLAITNPHGAVTFTLATVQDSTPRTYTFPGSVVGGTQPSTVSGEVTVQTFTYNGSQYLGGPAGVPSATWRGSVCPEGAAAPIVSGYDSLWCDSGSNRWKFSNNGGTTDAMVGAATTDTLTNKAFDTAGAGNSLKIAGTAITAVSGAGAVCLATGSVCGGTIPTPALPFGSISSGQGFAPSAGGANTVLYVPIIGSTFSSVTFVSFNSSTAHLAYGIYDSTCARVGNSTTVTFGGAANQLQTPTVSASLPSGHGYLGMSSDDAGLQVWEAIADSANHWAGFLAGGGATKSIFTGSNPSTGTTTIIMPATCGTPTGIGAGTATLPAISVLP